MTRTYEPAHRSGAIALLCAVATWLTAGPAIAAQDSGLPFLEFPLATRASAATSAPTVAWLIRQGDQTHIRVASGPAFSARTVLSKPDHDGAPISDVNVSPDGRSIVYTVGAAFGREQPYNPASLVDPPGPVLWVMSATGAAGTRRIGPGYDPVFTPDSSRLIYKHGKDMHVVELGASALSDQVLVPGGAAFSNIEWKSDGSEFAFVQDRGGYAFVGTYRPGDDRVRWLATDADRAMAPRWSPDGRQIAYLELPGREHTRAYDFTESEPLAIRVVDVANPRPRTLWRTSARAAMALFDDQDSTLRWVGQDRLVFLSEHDGWARLYEISASGGEPVALTPEKCEVAESELIGTGELFVIHNCADPHTRQASILDVRTRKQRSFESPDAIMAHAVAVGDEFIAFVGGSADAAPLPRVLDVSARKLVLREAAAAYGYRPSFDTAAPRVVTFNAEDGVTVPSQLFLPRAKGRNAALIFVHGGPQRQMFPAYHYSEYYARTYAFNRRLSELGYVVLSVNFRSGVGYGREFREADQRAWRGASEYKDVIAAARWLAARPDVDAKRIGIWGGSYGGLLTAQALARNSDMFAAGVAVHGVFDWSWPSSKQQHLNPSKFFGVSEATRERAFASSPLAAIDGWKSPVLLFSGDMDMNVDVLETVDLAQKLRARDVDVETVLVPGEAHGFVLHASWAKLWRDLAAFFDEHLRDLRERGEG